MRQWNEQTGMVNNPRSPGDIVKEAMRIGTAGVPKDLEEAKQQIERLAELVADLATHIEDDE